MIAQERWLAAGLRLPLGLKDVRPALAAGDRSATPMPLASLLRDRFLAAIGRGHAELDWSALALLAAEDAGLPPKPPPDGA